MRLPQYAAPFFQPLVLVPVEIVNQRILFRGAGAAGRLCLLDRSVGAGEQRVDGGKLSIECDGGSRSDAARLGNVTLQIVRDWVMRFNERGPQGLINGKAPGPPSLLNDQR